MTLAAEVFRPMALALMEWQEPPAPPWKEPWYLNPKITRYQYLDKQTNYGRDEYVDPFDVQADWEEYDR